MPGNVKQQIPVVAEGLVWMVVVGHVQLALRHPENRGPSAMIARRFVDILLRKLHKEGVLSGEEIRKIRNDQVINIPPRGPNGST